MMGNGPVRPVSDGVLIYVPPAASNEFAGSSWGGNKVLWAVGPTITDDVLIRGRQVDGPGGLRFGLAADPDQELVLPRVTPSRGPVTAWRDFPSLTRIMHTGCYAYQVDTATTSTIVVIEAR